MIGRLLCFVALFALAAPARAAGELVTVGVAAPAGDSIVERFARVVQQATQYTNTHQSQTVDLVAAFTGAEPETIAHMVRGINGTSLDPRTIQPTIDAAAKYHVIPQAFDAREMIGVSLAR